MSRILLFGATGYTGEMAARALTRRGLRPILAGRNADALEALAAELGGLETAAADAARPATVRALVERGDILVTTVGPMQRWGDAALDAALDAGAHYVDSSGESTFVRQVFEHAGPRAEAAGTLLLPATGYDSTPGNLAAALALGEAGEAATRVRVGYFLTGARRRGPLAGFGHMSGGSRETFATMGMDRAFAWRGGRLVDERPSARVGTFRVGATVRQGVSFGTSEALSLPRIYPSLSDIEVYWGWFDRASRLVQTGAFLLSGPLRFRGARSAVEAGAHRLLGGSARAPADEGTGSLFVAEALSETGEHLAAVTLEGINGYRFTGEILAWTAAQLATRGPAATGALGPVEAFGVADLTAGVAECGLTRSGA